MSVNAVHDREEIAPWVQFETRAIENRKATIEKGHYVADDVDYAIVTPAYSKDKIEHKADKFFTMREKDVRDGRMPQTWLDNWKRGYQAWKEGNEIPEDGISVKNWPAASPAEVQNMLRAGVRTIEQMAACNDEGIRRIGMGAQALKQRANSYLQTAKDTGKVAEANASLVKENERLSKQVESLSGKFDQLKSQMESSTVAPVVSRGTPEIGITDIVDVELTDEELPAAYEEKLGKKPHWKMKPETMREALK